MSNNTIYDSSQGYTRSDGQFVSNTLSENLSLLDDILYQLQQPTDTEGMFVRDEALADNAYMVLSQIQGLVPPEQQADVTAEFLRESGFSSDVVTQMLGIPRDAVDAALAGAGYDVTGQPLPEPTAEEMLGSTVGADTATLGETDDSSTFSTIPTSTTAADPNLAQQAGTAAGKVIDKVFQSLGLPSPTKVIGNPKPGATVVWGQTSGSPVIYTGTTPSGTQTGVTTGLPWLDAIINRGVQTVTGQAGVPDLGEISTVVIQEAARDALGLPAGADMGQITDAINKVGQATVAATTMAGEDTEGTDLFGVDLSGDKKIGDPNGDSNSSGNNTVDNSSGSDVVKTTDPQLPDDSTTTTTSQTSTDDPPAALRGGVEARDDLRGSVAPSVAGAVDTSGAVRGGLGSFFTSGGEGMDVRGSINPYEYETKGTLRTTPGTEIRGETPTSSGGSGFTLPPSVTTVREEPGELVDIDYLYDFAKGLDQPFVTTQEDEAMKNLYMYAEGGDVDNPDAVDMVTRRPGEYGRTYFDYATPSGFTPAGRALGGAALDPNAIQIPEYNYTRTLKPEFGGPASGATYTPPAIDTPPAETTAPATLTDTLGQAGLDTILANIGSIFGGGVGEVDTKPSVATPDVTETIYTTTSVQNPVQEYLSSLGYGTSPKSITKEDVGTFMGQQDFSLGDIASALGTTEDVLNQIYNFQPAAATTTITPASGTASLTPLQEYLVDQGFGSARDITKEDIANFGTSGFDIGDIASSLGVTTSDLNAIANYTTPTPDPDQALYDFFLDRGFVGTTKDVTPEDITAAEKFLAENPQFTVDDMAAMLGITEGYAAGGMAQGQGYYLGGPTDGMADLVPATIDGAQPAALSDGEFVIPADVVSHLGNGNSDAGAKQLYSMMDRVRDERTGTTKQGPEINPTKMMPA